jgi:hypothetical protein
MKESREAIWEAIHRLSPGLKKVNDTHGSRVINFTEALRLTAQEMFIKQIKENDDTRLIREALIELHTNGQIDHEEKE